jgi:predicted extracellular nuclease
MKRQGTFVLIAMLLAMMVSMAPVKTQAAVPTELFFSEYIEGSSYNKALEIYNGTGASVDLAVGGYNIQMFFNGSTTAGLTINLAGTVADGDVFVLANSNTTYPADPAILAQADMVSLAGFYNGDDAVVLRKGTTVLDVIGQIGYDPGTEWGTLLVSTADNTIRRKGTVCAGDPDGSNPFDPSLEWDGYIQNTFDGLGAHVANCTVVTDNAPSVLSSTPANGAVDVPLNSNIVVSFSEEVDVAGDWFNLTCSTSGVHTAVVFGGPTTFALDPDTDFVYGETCTLTVYAANVTDQDLIDPPNNMEADFTASFTAYVYVDVCTLPYTSIYEVQGNGLTSPLVGTEVTLEGIVVGDFQNNTSPDNGNLNGFHVQDEVGDGDVSTSDGIFIYYPSGATDVVVGDGVRVRGTVSEYNTMTEVTVSQLWICSSNNSISPTSVSLPVTAVSDFERYEGMLITFPQALVISEYFNYDRYGEMVLGLPLEGQSRLFTPTAVVEPGTPAIDLAFQNSLRRITLDDGLTTQNPAILRHPNGLPFGLTNLFRGGDSVANATGVLDYSANAYRIHPTAAADYYAVNLRPTGPEEVGGRMQIAAMNTLNYFLTLDYPTGDPLDNKCGPLLNMECRGADSDQPDELTRQRTKLMQALFGLDAAVIGLNEVENTTGVEPLADIVAGLNALYGYEAYAYINTGTIGTDAIKVGLIYRIADVTPVGDYALLTSAVDPRFIDTLNRPTLAQTFEENSTGARFTVAVNHLKSKGSVCTDDPDLGDGAGNCNLTRTLAAQALVDWLATDPTGSGDPDFIIMGDLNSYAKEDPIDAIRAGSDDILGTADDYTNLIYDYQGLYAYSYVFDGQNGYLDQALANLPLAAQVTGAVDWHINADEPDVLDYDTSFKPASQDALYEPNQYRTSDHDAVIVGLDLTSQPPTVDAGGPYVTSVNTGVSVSAIGYDLDGRMLTYAWDLDNNGSFETPGQSVTFVSAVTGIFPIAVQVTDSGGLTAVDQSVVIVYDRNGDFVTGGGWINAPDGKGEFSFSAKYVKRNPYPVGEFSYAVASSGLTFTSTSFNWLVVAGRYSWLRGTGVFNGMAGYDFLLSAEDGNVRLGGNGIDTFRIQIWDATGTLVYDSEPGAAEYAVPTTPLGGGSITVH